MQPGGSSFGPGLSWRRLLGSWDRKDKDRVRAVETECLVQ